jgi:hypothetical protein
MITTEGRWREVKVRVIEEGWRKRELERHHKKAQRKIKIDDLRKWRGHKKISRCFWSQSDIKWEEDKENERWKRSEIKSRAMTKAWKILTKKEEEEEANERMIMGGRLESDFEKVI